MPVHGFRFCFTPLAGVLFAFPSRYSCTIGSGLVFSLGSWSTRIRTGFLVPRPTQAPHHGGILISHTGLSPSSAALSGAFRYESPCFTPRVIPMRPYNPGLLRFGLLRVRSPLLAESLLISSPRLLRWFTSPGLAPAHYFIHALRCTPRGVRVTPFGNLRVSGCVLLSAAFRSLPRPSSPYRSTGIRRGPMIRLTILPLLPEPLSASGRAFLQASASLCSHSSESFIRFPSLFCQISLPFRHFMEIRGLEPLTLGLQSRCSSQLS